MSKRIPFFPKRDLPLAENVSAMMNENYLVWKNVYEDVYVIPLKYEGD